ncbi:MAG: RidA family protein [Pseudomonadota bacterium]
MLKALNPEDIRAPFARYSHAIEAPAGCGLVTVSGQLGIGADDVAPEAIEEQARLCFDNIDAILRSGGMNGSNVMRINAYVTDRADMPGYMAVRDRWIADLDPPTASTLMIVSGFTRPEFKVEIEVLAAKSRS